jgi:hypothetical protein
MTNFHGNEAKKMCVFSKKNSNGRLRPPHKAEQFPPKFHGLVLGLVELIDAMGINAAQSIWS